MPALLDLEIDPITRDFIDTADGQWQMASDSRTAVIWQLEERNGESWADDRTGSRLGLLLEREEPLAPEEVRDEVLRALQLLVDETIIRNLEVTILTDVPISLTSAAIAISYTDVASSRRVERLLVPFGGT